MRKNKLFLTIVACVLLISTVVLASVFVNAANTVKLTVNASNGSIEVYVDGTLKSEGATSAALNVPVGATVELVAKTGEGANEFMFWTDNVMNTVTPVSKDEVNKIKVTVTSDVTYTAHFAPANGSAVVYRNTNTTKQIIAMAEYSDANDFTEALVSTASKFGYTFSGWSMDVDAIKAKIGTDRVITVNPVYEATAEYTVSVVGGKITSDGDKTTGTYTIDTSITLAADNAGENDFVTWKDSKGNVVSSSKTFKVNVFANETYTAEVSTTAPKYDPYVKLTLSSVNDGRVDSQMYFNAGKNTLVEYGLIYAKDINCGDDELTIENADGVKIKKATFTQAGGVLVNYFESVERVSARGYLTYTDGNNTTTIYSNVAWSDVAELLDLKHELRVNEDGSFKVVFLTDVHGDNTDINGTSQASINYRTTIENIKTIVDREQPDLVLFGGDNFWNVTSEERARQCIEYMVSYIEEKQIPWAHVYGNHDDERNIGKNTPSKEKQQEIYESFEYCISKAGDEDLFGVGNYVLPVMTNDGSKIAFNIWALDSGSTQTYEDRPTDINVGGNRFRGDYEMMEVNQVQWYVETSELLEEYNGGVVPAMMYFHIPIQEMYAAWNFGTEQTGEKNENISTTLENTGLFSAILDRKDVSLIVNGHDHINDFSAKYRGVTFAYSASIGTMVYHDLDLVGGRVINFSMDNPTEFETHMSYIKERTTVDDANAPILNMVVGYDGEVTNGSSNGLGVDYNMYDGTSATVSFDTDINRSKISFVGGNNTPSTYTIDADNKINGNLANGFSFEVLFKVTQAYTGNGYLGILDQEEAGGWGLNIFKGTDATKVELSFEFAVSNGSGGRTWKDLRHEISINEWCHCVGVYDKDNNKIELYVDGTLVGTMEVTTEMVPSGASYICVGGCAQVTHLNRESTGINGFVGDIAICNILSVPTDAEGVKAMHEAATTKPEYILNLTIDENGNVDNGEAAPVLVDNAGTTGTKTVTSDNAISRKFVRFAGSGTDGASSTYYIPFSSSAEAMFKDGFAIELMFRANANDHDTAIIDFCEGGGFGIGFNNKNLVIELGHSTKGYAKVTKAIELNKWYHLVVDFNADTNKLTVYLDGESIAEQAVTTGYRGPEFGANPQYISIGSRADKGLTCGRGFQGDIAIANIYTDSVTATEVEALYNAAKPEYIVNLYIDENGNVDNGAADFALVDYAGVEGTSKTVTSDDTINRKFIHFSGSINNNASYYLPFLNAEEVFSDGFAAETMFRVTEVKDTKNYGILDYCQGGGFGISIEKNNVLLIELGQSAGGYASVRRTIELNKWYHLVVDFNKETSKLTVYLNGEVVGNVDVTTGYRNQTAAQYIAIGARADGSAPCGPGFTGDIAIANIYADSVTATEAAALYAVATAK